MSAETKPSTFGSSLRLDDGDLAFERGDLVIVSGKPNLQQGLMVMLGTPFGSDVFNTAYGFDAVGVFTHQTTPRQTKDLIRLQIVRSVSADNRIREFTSLVFSDEPAFTAGLPNDDAAALLQERKSARRWQARLVLETVGEGEVALQLEGSGLKP